jgi:hypothetical protein
VKQKTISEKLTATALPVGELNLIKLVFEWVIFYAAVNSRLSLQAI